MAREQRLVFGEAAELYHRARPGYPLELVADVVARLPAELPRTALEIGAGTGRATVMFAAQGLRIVALEPDPAMASFAASVAPEVVNSDFEAWEPAGRRFGLVFCAQAWHWLRPMERAPRARAVLQPGGLLAAFWNRPVWDPAEPLTRALRELYGAQAPELLPGLRLDAGGSDDQALFDTWRAEAEPAGLVGPEFRRYRWSLDYSSESYVELLSTQSPHRLLDPRRREQLLRQAGALIDRAGGRFTLPYETWLCQARAPGAPSPPPTPR
jgi:SAM-dependent methyltransferase